MNNSESGQKNKNMQAVKNKDSKIELMLRHELWIRGVRYRKNVTRIFGKPDIAFIGKKVAVFCDSEFWHGYDWDKQKDKIKTKKSQRRWRPMDGSFFAFGEMKSVKMLVPVRTSLSTCLRREVDAIKNNRPMCGHRRYSPRIRISRRLY